MAVQILFRRGTSTEWTSANPTLGAGEPGIETNTGKIKVGDGSTLWNALPYAAGLESLRLQDLSNVASTAPSTGQVLKWNGTAWAPAADETGGGGADGNTTYGISAETVSGGVNLRLTGSDSSIDNVKLTAGSNITLTRTTADEITIDAAGGGGTSSNSFATIAVAGQTSVAADSATDTLTLVAGTNITITTDATTDAITINSTASGGGAMATRAALSGATSSLTDGQTGPINITGYKSYMLMKVATSAAAWVRIYTSEAARTADASRLEGTDPAPGAGVIAEVITTGAQTVFISPGALGWNDETVVTTNIPVRVTNKSGATAAITVTLTALQLEA